MELLEAIQKRNSTRKMTDYYVTDDEIKQIIQAGLYAPSWANTQVWEFIVVRERDIIQQMGALLKDTNPAKKCTTGTSALIAVLAKKNVSGFKENEKATKFNEWFMFDLGMAVENMFLYAYSIGIGTVVIGEFDHAKLSKMLHLPNDTELVCLLPLGKPQNPDRKSPPRKEIKDCVYLDRYNEKFASIY